MSPPLLARRLAAFALLGAAAALAEGATCIAGLDFSTPDSDLIDNGDATVTHKPTGLMWKKCTEGQTAPTCTGAATLMNWTQIQAAAAAANAAPAFAGHNDWRIPNVKELVSIVETGCHDAAINTTRFPATQNSHYWSGTSYQASPSFAWDVDFSVGQAAVTSKTSTHYLRLVRGGKSFGGFDPATPPSSAATGTSATGTGQIGASFTGGGANCTFADTTFTTMPAPAGITFPHGIVDLTVYNCTGGSTLTFNLVFPSMLPAGTRLWKYGPTPDNATPHWYVLPATIAGNQVQYTLEDGKLGDDDSVVNGRIVDPVGPGVPSGAVAFNLDLDANLAYDPLTDGLLLIRYLAAVTGPPLVAGLLGSGAGRVDSGPMLTQLNNIRPLLDVDGNGTIDLATDGLMLMRYLFGLRGDALVANALGADPKRSTSEIEAHIQSLMPALP